MDEVVELSPKWDSSSPIPVDRGSQRSCPTVLGKSVYSGETKLWIKGVTYGTFRPDASGNEFHDYHRIEADFRSISSNGFNAIRTYTVPPRELLDLASGFGLHVMVGLAWEQHITFLDTQESRRKIRRDIRAHVRSCAGHSAVLCFALGSEIPAPIARWYGPRRIERFLQDLWADAKSEDPGALFTYVNYPSTEYLSVDFADLFCFNVYLENRRKLADYIAHLHNLCGDRPLILSELGLDSLRHGQEKQAETLAWQIRTAFAEGCSGAFVFSWTDEWHRGGHDIEDWAFGLTDRRRRSKPALETVARALAQVPFASGVDWPRISVVVCTYNGERTIRQCLDGLLKLDYPNHEVIVVDDGSTDTTADIAREYPFRLINTENRGLGSARNTGYQAATGEIIAYIDDDAYPVPEWLKYLAITFMTADHAAAGGPNLPPPADDFIENAVALAPGGPIHVLLTDRVAEHIPGCNMAIRKSCLEAIGGFDATFRVAGDDVDVCWRLQQRGWTLGFNASAVVWHHRRNSIRAYWKQQRGYGRAEALLETKWPEKYNGTGHPAWMGRIYSPGIGHGLKRARRIFHGVWGSALFQSVYQPAPGLLSSVALMPEWYLVIGILALLSGIGVMWRPLLVTLPLLAGAAAAAGVQAGFRAVHACRFLKRTPAEDSRVKLVAAITLLYGLQPLARLFGRLQHGLSPWRRRGMRGWAWPWPRRATIWSEHWRSLDDWLRILEGNLRKAGARVVRGGAYDRWDLEISNGTCGSVRLKSVAEEHGQGKQLVRFRLAPRCSVWAVLLVAVPALLAASAAWDGARPAALIMAVFPVAFSLRILGDTALATSTALHALRGVEKNADARNKSIATAQSPATAKVAAVIE